MIKIGDRVFIISYKETGTVINRYTVEGHDDTVVVSPDNPENVFPREKDCPPDAARVVTIHTTEKDLELLGLTPNPEHADIWEQNSK